MRWKIKIKPQDNKPMIVGRKCPNIGDIKEKVRFAFFPVKINKENVVWLEKYVEVYEYKIQSKRRPTVRNIKDFRDIELHGTAFDWSEEWYEVPGWVLKEKKFN